MDTLEYIQYRINNNEGINEKVCGVDWSEARIYNNPIQLLKNIIKINNKDLPTDFLFDKDDNFEADVVEDNKRKNVKIIYKKNIIPDVFRWSEGTHDGTLLFSLEHIGHIFEDLVNGASCKIGNIPEKEYMSNEDIWWQYDVIYYVSDLLWHTKYVDHVDENNGKMFPGQQDNMVMAVQMEYTKHV